MLLFKFIFTDVYFELIILARKCLFLYLNSRLLSFSALTNSIKNNKFEKNLNLNLKPQNTRLVYKIPALNRKIINRKLNKRIFLDFATYKLNKHKSTTKTRILMFGQLRFSFFNRFPRPNY